MFRSKEMKWGLLFLLLGGAAAAVLTYLAASAAVWWVTAFWIMALAVFLIVCLIRHRKLNRISVYLRRILNGEKRLGVPDNEEGELSLLQNDIYKLVTRLETQAELLTADKRYLADSLSDISHQLKTPMTSMMVMTDILGDQTLPPEKRAEFTAAIRAQLERMEWLLTSLLKISKLDAGTIQFRKEPVHVRELVEKAVEHLLIPMELKNQSLVIDISENQMICCDFQWTAEAISNIAKNCMEHTPDGGTITIYSEEKGLYLQLVITDTGEGIAPEDLPHIFERFYKGKNAGKDSVGIGLAMAKYIMNIQNGQLEAESTPGQGSRFSIRLYRKIV